MKKRKLSKRLSPLMQRIEDRVMFDAAPDAVLLLPQNQADHSASLVPVQVEQAEVAQWQGTRELVIVDGSVEDSQALLRDLIDRAGDSALEIRLLDQDQDGVDQVSQILAEGDGYSAVHIISHGADGAVQLGNTLLSSDNLSGFAGQIGLWGDSLTDDADILFYGCNLAESDNGLEFLESLQHLTGADIAASDDLTGHEELGGDWELEAELGSVEATAISSADWKGLLAPPSAVADTLTVQPGSSENFDPRSNDTDPEGDPLSITHITDPATGSPTVIGVGSPVTLATGTVVALNADGTLTVTPASDMAETETFDYTVSDGNSGSTTAAVTLQRDTDGDNVIDIDDIDDDNDGILDVNEGFVAANPGLSTSVDEAAGDATYFGSYSMSVDGLGTSTPGLISIEKPDAGATVEAIWVIAGGAALQGDPGPNPLIVNGVTPNLAHSETSSDVFPGFPSSSTTRWGEVSAQLTALTATLNSAATGITNVNVVESNPSATGLEGSVIMVIWNDPSVTEGTISFNIGSVRASDGMTVDLPVGSIDTSSPNYSAEVGVGLSFSLGSLGQVSTVTINGQTVTTNAGGFDDGSNANGELFTVGGVGDDPTNNTDELYDVSGLLNDMDTQITVDVVGSPDDYLVLTYFRAVGVSDPSVESSEDSDGDGVADHLDIDKDNDGITDNVEAQSTSGYIAPSGQGAAMVDVDGDGLDDNYDLDTNLVTTTAATSIGLVEVNTDGDSNPDTLDADSDNDGTDDVAERGDGQATAIPLAPFNDADHDGLLDEFEGGTTTDGYDVNDANIAGDDGGIDGDYSHFDLADIDLDTNANEAVANRTTNDAVALLSDVAFRDAVDNRVPPRLDLDTTDVNSLIVASDDFQSGGFAGGTGAWTTNWTFVDLNTLGGGTNADVGVESRAGSLALFVQDDSIAVQRTVDLTGALTATLEFDFLRDELDVATDQIRLEVSTDGVNFTVVDATTFVGPNSDGTFQLDYIADLTPFISSNTTIRFSTSASLGGSDELYVDNLEVVATLEPPVDYSTSYLTNATPVAIASTNTGISDGDSANLSGATISMAGPQSGDAFTVSGAVVLANATGTIAGTTIDYSVSADGFTISLTNVNSLSDYETAIESIGFVSSGTSLVDRTIQVQVVDEQGFASNVATTTIAVDLDSDGDGVANAVDIDDDNDGITDLDEIANAQSLTRINVFSEDFGAGGRTLTPFTTYTYEDGLPGTGPTIDVDDGEYAVAQTTGELATFPAWEDFSDHTGDANGRMLVVNASFAPDEFYRRSITVSENSFYEFSAFVRNVIRPGTGVLQPNVTFEIQDLNGDLIASATTGPIAEDSQWHNVGVTFSSGNNSSIQLVILNNGPGGGGNDLAIDDIHLDLLEADTDSDNIADIVDIDSDNDGITDNVEAQTTAGYIAPSGQNLTMIDTNNDGLDDNYDTGIIAGGDPLTGHSGIGLTPVDTDSDTIADYVDTDSDNDETLDIAERGDGQPTLLTSTLDTDGDGLVDIFEGADVNDGFDVNDENIVGDDGGTDGDYSRIALADIDSDTNANENVSNRTSNDAVAMTSDLDFRDELDTDGDSIADHIDIDDDNDGILDVNEGFVAPAGTGPKNIVLLIDQSSSIFGSEITEIQNGLTSFINGQIGSGNTISFVGMSHQNTDQNAGQHVLNVTFPTDGTDVTAAFDTWIANYRDGSVSVSSDFWSSALEVAAGMPLGAGDEVIIITDGAGGSSSIARGHATTIEQMGAHLFAIGMDNHTYFAGANRNIDDAVSLVFDNDPSGTGGAIQEVTDYRSDYDSAEFDRVTSFANLSGALSQLGGVLARQVDTDGDGIADHLDIDKDNDGITDNVEAQTTAGYIAPSGIGTGITDIDGDGLDDNYDSDTNIGTTTAATSVGLTEVDTDGDGMVDTIDADSDNDGTSDMAEAGHGQTISAGDADADGDGLKDSVDAISGFDVNDDDLTGSTFNLSDSDLDTAADGSNASPTRIDFDYRDNEVVPPIIDLDKNDSSNAFDGMNPFVETVPDTTAVSTSAGGTITLNADANTTISSTVNRTFTADDSGDQTDDYPYSSNSVPLQSLLLGGTGTTTIDLTAYNNVGNLVFTVGNLLNTNTVTITGTRTGGIPVDFTGSFNIVGQFIPDQVTSHNGINEISSSSTDLVLTTNEAVGIQSRQVFFNNLPSDLETLTITQSVSTATDAIFVAFIEPQFDYADTFVEGAPPVSVTDESTQLAADAFDFENNITQLTIVPGGIVDGSAEELSINGQIFDLSTDLTVTALTVGTSTIDIAYVAGTFTITENGGGVLPQADIDLLLQTITYENTNTGLSITEGDRTFAFTLADPASTSNTAVATITVVADNVGPVANNDTYTVVPGVTTNIDPVGDNDTDADGDPLTITEIVDPATGMPMVISVGSPVTLSSGTIVELLGDGTLDITQLAGADGVETFDYTISDGRVNDTATVSLRSDTDADGIANVDDIDDDNDGITDVEEYAAYTSQVSDATLTLTRYRADTGQFVTSYDYTAIVDSFSVEVAQLTDLAVAGRIISADPLSMYVLENDGTVNRYSNSNGVLQAIQTFTTVTGGQSDAELVADLVNEGRLLAVRSNTLLVLSETTGQIERYQSSTGAVTYDQTYTPTALTGGESDGETYTDLAAAERVLGTDETHLYILSDNSGRIESYRLDTGAFDAINTPTGFTNGDLDGETILEAHANRRIIGVSEFEIIIVDNHDLLADTDGDGIDDRLDIDKDNDGITDNVEAQTTAGYIAPSGTGAGITDVNRDGLDDVYDTRNGSLISGSAAATTAEAVINEVDTDSDGTVDTLDSDSDGDGVDDIAERGDSGPTSVTSTTDSDGDGLLDVFEDGDGSGTPGDLTDGFDVNDENRTGSTLGLAGVTTLASDGSNAVPLARDLLFRDVNDAPRLDLDGDDSNPVPGTFNTSAELSDDGTTATGTLGDGTLVSSSYTITANSQTGFGSTNFFQVGTDRVRIGLTAGGTTPDTYDLSFSAVPDAHVLIDSITFNQPLGTSDWGPGALTASWTGTGVATIFDPDNQISNYNDGDVISSGDVLQFNTLVPQAVASWAVTVNADNVNLTYDAVGEASGETIDFRVNMSSTSHLSTFTEGGNVVSIADIDSSITDADDTHIESATIVFTNPQADDVLTVGGTTLFSGGSVHNNGSITVNGNAYTVNSVIGGGGEVTVTLTGSYTKAQYAAAIEVITFNNTSQDPNTTDRLIEVTVHDGDASSNTANSLIQVVPANDAPVVDLDGDNSTTGVTEQVTFVETVPGTNLSATTSAGTVDAEVINGNGISNFSYTYPAFPANQDTYPHIWVSNSGGPFSITFDLSGYDNPEDLMLLVGNLARSSNATITALDSNGDPVDLTTSFGVFGEFTPTTPPPESHSAEHVITRTAGQIDLASDGTENHTRTIFFDRLPANLQSITISASSIGNDGIAFGFAERDFDAVRTFTEGDSPVSIADVDRLVSDSDDTNIESGVITLTNPQSDDQLFVDGLSVSGSETGTISGTSIGYTVSADGFTVTLSGSDTKANYETAIEAIEFENTSVSPDTTDRVIEVTVNDGDANSNTAQTTIRVFSVNDVPVAEDNTATVAEDGTLTDSGNVIADDDGQDHDSNSVFVDLDADGDTLIVTDVDGNAVSGATNVVGAYGTLTINPDGSYTYNLDNANSDVQALGDTDTLTETFNYTISDQQQLISNGDFSAFDPAIDLNSFNASLPNGWSNFIGSPDLIDSSANFQGLEFIESPTGGPFVHAIGSGSAFETFRQTLTGLVPGQQYTLNFSQTISPYDQAGAGGQTGNWVVDVFGSTTFNSSAMTTPALGSGPVAWTNQTFTFTATGTSQVVQFAANSLTAGTVNDRVDLAIDGISITQLGAKDTANLIVTINGTDDPITFGGTDDGSAVVGADAEVTEADLAFGSNAAGTGETATGAFTISAPDGIVSLEIAGTTITLTQLNNSATTNIVVSGAEGDLTINGFNAATGEVSYSYTLTSNADHSGGQVIDSFAMTLTDDDGDTQNGTLGVLIVDDTPTAVNDSYIVLEDGGLIFVLVGSNDVIGADFSGAQISGVVAGTGTPVAANLNVNINGAFGQLQMGSFGGQYIVDNSNPAVQALSVGQSVTDVFTYELSDADGDTSIATLSIDIFGRNDAPIAEDNTATVTEDGPLSDSGNVINDDDGQDHDSNSIFVDQDIDGDTLIVTDVDGTSVTAGTNIVGMYGTLTINPDGTYTYNLDNANPDVQSLGDVDSLTETFTYTINDQVALIFNGDLEQFDSSIDTSSFNGELPFGWEPNNGTPDIFDETVSVFGLTYDPSPTGGIFLHALAEEPDFSREGFQQTLRGLIPGEQYTVNFSQSASSNSFETGQQGQWLVSAGGTTFSSAVMTAPAMGTALPWTNQSFTFTATSDTEILSFFANSVAPGVGGNHRVDLVIDGISISQVGASDTAELIVTIQGDDDPVSIALVPGPVVGTHAEVLESDMASGTNAAGTGETATGTFTITALDGINTLQVGSEVITLAQLNNSATTNIVAAGTFGDFTINGFNAATGEVSYSYTLTSNADHSGGSVIDSLSMRLTDDDGDFQATTFRVVIVDDAPSAVFDVESVTEEQTQPATGNVITGIDLSGGDSNTTDGVADLVGADANANPVTGVTTGIGTPAAGNVGSGLAGLYGTLTLQANGDYSYVLDNSNPTVQALGSGDTLTEIYTYEITDGDGDTAVARLTITVNGLDDPISFGGTNNGSIVIGADAEVLESDLAIGSNAAGTGETATGTFTISAPDGINTLQIGSELITLAQLNNSSTTNIVVTGALGDLTINGFNASTGEVSYSYTLTSNGDHSGGQIIDDFAMTLTDDDGDMQAGTLGVLIVDDVPAAVADVDSVTEDQAPPATGNVITGVDLSGGDGNSTDGVADTLGADANANPVTGVATGLGAPAAGNVASGLVGLYGTLTLQANGDYSYALDNSNPSVQALSSGVTLTEVYTYEITDGDGDPSTATLTITINGLDDPINFGGTEDGSVVAGADAEVLESNLSTGSNAAGTGETAVGTFTISAPDGINTLQIGSELITLAQLNNSATTNIVVASAQGELTINGFNASTGEVSYSYTLTSNADHSGGQVIDSFAMTLTDDDGDMQAGTLGVLIADDAPTAVADTGSVTEDSGIPATGNVTSNDLIGADATGTPVTAVVAGTGSPSGAGNIGVGLAGNFGTLTLNPDGSYSYVLNDSSVQLLGSSQSLNDIFTYEITDSDGETSTETLNITINGSDDPIIITDVQDGPVAGTDAQVFESNLVIGTNPTGSGETAAGTLRVIEGDSIAQFTVNGTPVTSGFSPTSPLTFVGTYGTLSFTDFDFATDSISYSYTLSSPADHSGGNIIDQFTLQVIDVDGDSLVGTLGILVVDDAPIANDDVDSVQEDQSQPATGNVFTGFDPGAGDSNTTDGVADTLGADANANPVTGVATGLGTPATGNVASGLAGLYGTLTLQANGDYSYVLDNSNPAVQALGSGDSLTEIYTYEITDGDGDPSTATLTITINGMDDPITFGGTDDGNLVVGADAEVLESHLATGSNAAGTGETANGTFTISAPDGINTLQIGSALITLAQLNNSSTTNIVVSSALGDLTINGFNASTGEVSYSYTLTSNADHSGGQVIDSFAMTLTDDDGDMQAGTLGVLVVDDAPAAVADNGSVTEDFIITATGNVASNDLTGADETGQPITAVVVGTGSPAGAGNLGVGLAGNYGVLILSSSGSFSYMLVANNPDVQGLGSTESLQEVFTYEYTDSDGDTSTATLTILINGSDDPIVITNLDDGPVAGTDAQVFESDLATGTNAAGVQETATGSFTIEAGDEIAGFAVNGTPVTSAPPVTFAGTYGSLTLTGFDSATNTVSYSYTLTTAADHSGGNIIDQFSLLVTDDDGDTLSRTLGILVVDDAPVAMDDVDSLQEDQTQPATGNVFTATDVVAGDGNSTDGVADVLGADANATPVTGVAVGLGTPVSTNVGTGLVGTYGTLTLDSAGNYSYVLDNLNSVVQALAVGESLNETFSYEITDLDGDTATATLTLTVVGVNDAPVAVPDTASGVGPDPISGNVLPNDSDPDGDPLTVSTIPVTPPTNGTVQIQPNGTFTYVPNPEFTGTDSFEYEVCDDQGACSTAIVTITVFNAPPVAVDDFYELDGSSVSGSAFDNDFDPNNDPLTGTVITQPEHGTVQFNPDGTFTYTPGSTFIGSDSFQYQVCDDEGACSEAFVTIGTSFGYDSFTNQAESKVDAVYERREILFNHALHAFASEPVLSGYATPGATLVGKIYSVEGSVIGEATTTSSSAGNWVMNFFGVHSEPGSYVVIEHVLTEEAELGDPHHFRLTPDTYRSFQLGQSHLKKTTIGTIISDAPKMSLEVMHEQNVNPLSLLN